MSKVVWHITMSVDGYIAAPGDEMDWMGDYELESPVGAQVIRDTGAMLAGRRWHDLAIERWDGRHGIYGGHWTGPVFVITHHPPAEPPDPEITFLSDGIDQAIVTARQAAGPRDVGILGANTAHQAMAAGLVDEIVIHVVPLLLGGGIPLFGPELERVRLERLYLGQSATPPTSATASFAKAPRLEPAARVALEGERHAAGDRNPPPLAWMRAWLSSSRHARQGRAPGVR